MLVHKLRCGDKQNVPKAFGSAAFLSKPSGTLYSAATREHSMAKESRASLENCIMSDMRVEVRRCDAMRY